MHFNTIRKISVKWIFEKAAARAARLCGGVLSITKTNETEQFAMTSGLRLVYTTHKQISYIPQQCVVSLHSMVCAPTSAASA